MNSGLSSNGELEGCGQNFSVHVEMAAKMIFQTMITSFYCPCTFSNLLTYGYEPRESFIRDFTFVVQASTFSTDFCKALPAACTKIQFSAEMVCHLVIIWDSPRCKRLVEIPFCVKLCSSLCRQQPANFRHHSSG